MSDRLPSIRQRVASRATSRLRAGRGLIVHASLLLLAGGAVFVSAPQHGDFGYVDAARHALNGAFVLDFLKALPFDDPVGWATRYYLQYPAITVGYYPPLFYVPLALCYAAFGVTQQIAVALDVAFLLLLAAGTYALVSRCASRSSALAGAFLMMAAPLVSVWARQVMLDVPMLALATWSVVYLLRYVDSDRLPDLLVSAAVMVLALYTKQQAAFIAAGASVGVILVAPRRSLRVRHWLVAGVLLVALLPLVWMQLRFGSFSLEAVELPASAFSTPGAQPQGRSAPQALWYFERMPAMAGPALFLALVFIGGCLVSPSWRVGRSEALVLGGWFVISYLCLTTISWKDERFALPLLPPVVVAGAWCLDRLTRRLRPWIAPAVAAALLNWSLTAVDVPAVGGYRRAAELVAQLAPPNARVMFVGNRDGAFTFHMRASTDRRDLTVVRADKLFLGIVVSPEAGLRPKDMTREEVQHTLERYAITHVVAEPDVWREAQVVAELHDILRGPRFLEIARVPVTGLAPGTELTVLRNIGPIADQPEPLTVELPVVGLTFQEQ